MRMSSLKSPSAYGVSGGPRISPTMRVSCSSTVSSLIPVCRICARDGRWTEAGGGGEGGGE